MTLLNSHVRYGGVSISLHWLMACMIIICLIQGQVMVGLLPGHQWRAWMYASHKQMGFILGILALVRMWVTMVSKRVKPAEGLAPWQHWLSQSVHHLMRVTMVGLPLSGWLMSIVVKKPPKFFGWPMTLSLPITNTKHWSTFFWLFHGWIGKLLMLLIVMHVLGAVFHVHQWGMKYLNRMCFSGILRRKKKHQSLSLR